jgi:hypothetical protein
VLSPATLRIDRVVKMPIYAQQGVQWLWLVEPDLHTLEVFRLHDSYWLLESTRQKAAEVHATPFQELASSLADLWLPETAGSEATSGNPGESKP